MQDISHCKPQTLMACLSDDDEATVTLMSRLPSLKAMLDSLMQDGDLREVSTHPAHLKFHTNCDVLRHLQRLESILGDGFSYNCMISRIMEVWATRSA